MDEQSFNEDFRGFTTDENGVTWINLGRAVPMSGAVPTEYTDEAHAAYKRAHPMYFYPDGKPIVSDGLLDDTMKWALLFEETKYRIVGKTKTLWGEKLSTMWLGMDHGFGCGQPLIFETMLFAPVRGKRHRYGEIETDCERRTREANEAYTTKHFPHDQLQLRYASKNEAEDMHELLKLHCLIPPRWRHFLLATVGGWWMWKRYDEEAEDDLCR
jgi:hypothetical protein